MSQFYALYLAQDNNDDLQQWVDDGVLVGIVDEALGGIIGYVHEEHVDWVVKALEES